MGSEAVWHWKKSTGLRIRSLRFNSWPCLHPVLRCQPRRPSRLSGPVSKPIERPFQSQDARVF